MKRSDTYTSGWVKAKDMLEQGFSNGQDLTIVGIESKTMDDGNKQRVLSFDEIEQKLGLNATNWDEIASLTGKDDDDLWIGSRFNFFPHKLDRPYQGATHGIRVRHPLDDSFRPAPGAARTAPRAAPVAARTAPGPTYSAAQGRTDAWKLYRKNNPGEIAAVTPGWLALLANVFPGKQQQVYTVENWRRVQQYIENPAPYQGEPDEPPTGVVPTDGVPGEDSIPF